MAGKLSSTKGALFERSVAKSLSLALTDGKDAYAVSRRSASGGSMRDKMGLSSQGGDLQSDKKEARWFFDMYCVELKHYADLKNDLWSFFEDEGRGKIYEFIKQAKKAAEVVDKHYLLIVKTNRKAPLVITRMLVHTAGVNYWRFRANDLREYAERSLYLCDFESFLANIKLYSKKIKQN